jgi:hypothetical protein
MKAVRESQRYPPGLNARSFKCCGLRPSLPPADPGAKLLMASRTRSQETTRGVTVKGGDGLRSSGWNGCLDVKLSIVEVDKEARDSEDARERAPRLASPSCILNHALRMTRFSSEAGLDGMTGVTEVDGDAKLVDVVGGLQCG